MRTPEKGVTEDEKRDRGNERKEERERERESERARGMHRYISSRYNGLGIKVLRKRGNV